MTELELTGKAKEMIDKMANGINPITGEYLAETDCVNNVRISRCFFFISDILRQVLERGGLAPKKKIPFFISEDQLQNFRYSDEPLFLSEIARRINELTGNPDMKKITYVDISAYLMDEGYLTYATQSDGKTVKLPTIKGEESGMHREERMINGYQRLLTRYDRSAQNLILSSLPFIIHLMSQRDPKAA
jgi:hypothetical protein